MERQDTEDVTIQEEGEFAPQIDGRAGDEGWHGCENIGHPEQVYSTPATQKGDLLMSEVFGTSAKQKVPWRMDASS